MSGGTDTWQTDRDRTEQEYWLKNSDVTVSLRYGWCCSQRHQPRGGARMQQSSGVTQCDQFKCRPLHVVYVCVHWTARSEIPKDRTGNRKCWGTRSKTHLEPSTEVETRKTPRRGNRPTLIYFSFRQEDVRKKDRRSVMTGLFIITFWLQRCWNSKLFRFLNKHSGLFMDFSWKLNFRPFFLPWFVPIFKGTLKIDFFNHQLFFNTPVNYLIFNSV